MHALIHLPESTLTALIAEWRAEHADYYGTPCGARVMRFAPDEVLPPPEFDLGAGQRGAEPGEWALIRAGFSEAMDGSGRGLWMRCSGVWLLADPALGTLEVCGTRHSIRLRLPRDVASLCMGYEYRSTQRPDLMPWETEDLSPDANHPYLWAEAADPRLDRRTAKPGLG